MRRREFLLTKSALIISLAMTLGISSCSKNDLYNPDYAEEQQENQYNQNFNTLIGGTVSPNQNWNMSTTRTLAINVGGNTSANYTLKLYTANPYDASADARLLATSDVKGGTVAKLSVQVPSELETLYIGRSDSYGYTTIKAANLNDNVSTDFSSRAIATRADAFTKGDDGFAFIQNAVVKDAISQGKLQETVNAGKLTNDYDLKAKTGTDVILYPIYSQTGGNDTAGYIIYSDGNMPTKATINNYKKVKMIEGKDDLRNYLQPYWKNVDYRWTEFNPSPLNPFYFESNFNYWFTTTNGSINVIGGADVYSKPFTIKLATDEHLILYITQNKTTYYSLKSLNSDNNIHSAIVNTDNGYSFAGLEDYGGSGSDYDCNDIIFVVQNAEAYTKTKDVDIINTVAFEDLGSTDDFDFNDVVLKVAKHDKITESYDPSGNITGTTTETIISGIWLAAAGGTLPTHVYYKPTENDVAIDLFGEIHNAFGVDTKVMVNTGSGSSKDVIKTTAIKTWPTYCQVSQSDPTPGFYITVEVTNDNGTTTTREIKLPSLTGGSIPQGFYIPYNWSWPTERTKITDAYTNFATWATSGVDNKWYETPVDGKVINKTFTIE